MSKREKDRVAEEWSVPFTFRGSGCTGVNATSAKEALEKFAGAEWDHWDISRVFVGRPTRRKPR